MRVLSVKLQSFGGLSGRFNLDPQLTVVGGPNESGKSTLHTALRVALCGVDLPARGRMPKETEEVLRHFRPWQGKRFSVEAEIELDGGRYRFVRDLDQPDNCQVFDLIKGGEVTDRFRRGRTVDVSVALGMSREAFLAISTVGQDQILSLTGSSLQEDLQKASSTSGSDSTARSAIELLQRWRQDKIRGDRTTTKPLDKQSKLLDETAARLSAAVAAHSQLSDELATQARLRSELAEAEQSSQSAEVAWKTAELAELNQDLAAVAELSKELEATPELKLPKEPTVLRDAATGARGLAQQWQEADAKAKEPGPPGEELERLSQKSAPSELAFLIAALEQPLPELPGPAELPSRLELLDRRRVATHRWFADVLALVGGIAGVLLVAGGIVLSTGGLRIGLVVAGLVLLVLTATGFLALQRRLRLLLAVGGFSSVSEMERARRAGDPQMSKAVAARNKVETERSQATKRLTELGIGKADPSHLRQLAEQLPAAQEAAQQRAWWAPTAQRFREELLVRAKRVGVNGSDPVKLAAELAARLHQLDAAEDARQHRDELEARRGERLAGREPKALAKRAKELSAELGSLPTPAEPLAAGLSSAQLRLAHDEARAKLDRIRQELLPLQGRLAEQLREAGDVAKLDEELAELRSEVARLTAAEAAVKLAIAEMERAQGLVHNDLAPVLAEGLRGWLPGITAQRYQQAWVDPSDLSMHVSAREGEAQVSVQDLSQGTREQIYVALRMVLAKALSPSGESVPLILDDPTVSSDDARCTALLDTLKELSATAQVVIFSHETRVGGWAKRSGVPILSMKLVPASAPGEEVPPAEVTAAGS
jgi:DNA repair exonuclease SbcCD ATPase subunit